jgi:hypothetical protein
LNFILPVFVDSILSSCIYLKIIRFRNYFSGDEVFARFLERVMTGTIRLSAQFVLAKHLEFLQWLLPIACEPAGICMPSFLLNSRVWSVPILMLWSVHNVGQRSHPLALSRTSSARPAYSVSKTNPVCGPRRSTETGQRRTLVSPA